MILHRIEGSTAILPQLPMAIDDGEAEDVLISWSSVTQHTHRGASF
jgi:hypothetical protein